MKIEFDQTISKGEIRIYDVDGIRSVCIYIDSATELIIPEENWNNLVSDVSEAQQDSGSPTHWIMKDK